MKSTPRRFSVAVLLATLLLTSQSHAATLNDYQQLKVYGVQQQAPTSISQALALLSAGDQQDGEAVIHRFLVYDALNQYLGFLLHVNEKPGIDYFNRFNRLADYVEVDFVVMQRDAVQTAIRLSRELRFDVSMVQLSTKEIYNKDQAPGIDQQIETILSRLSKISNKLKALYPESEGELPSILLAYVSSVFTPKTEAERIACAKKFSEEIKSDVFRILATQELEGQGQLLQTPVIYNITPMGSISSRAKNGG